MKSKNNNQSTNPVNHLDDGNVQIKLTIPLDKIKIARQKALQKLAQNIEIKGFRPGKAPISLAEKQIKKEAIYEEIIKELVPEAYINSLKANNIKPIVNPKVQLISADDNKDWLIEATTCEKPEVVLNGYQQSVRNATAADKIIIPGKDTGDTEANKNKKLDLVFKTLLQSCQIKLPSLLIDEEVNQMLSRLLDQTEKLGITIEQYLQSTQKTGEQLHHEYRHQAEDTLKLEFILSKIADEEKVEIKEEEVEKMIASVPDEKTKKTLDDPRQKAYIRQILKKQRVIDSLLAL